MSTLNAVYHLRAPRLSTDLPVEPAENLPSEVAGQPATYFWKELIHAGQYIHPAQGFELHVDSDRMRRWMEAGEKMLAAGVPVPISCDHSDSAHDVIGYIRRFRLDDNRLLGLCQFIGEDAALTAARNRVSIGIDPEFTDGEARNWGEAIVHVALTPAPVVPDQGEFEPVLMNMSLSAEVDDAIMELTSAKFDAAVQRGGLSPGARDRLVALLVKADNGKPNVLTLSRRGADRSLAQSVAEILLDNPPVPLGEQTPMQTLPRTIPGEDPPGLQQLRSYMTRVASVSSG